MSKDSIETTSTEDYSSESPKSEAQQRLIIVGVVILLIILITGIVLAVIAMVNNPTQTETIRDIVIIFMAVESLLLGLTLVVLIVQLARLTALLQNEVKPILDSTNDTLNTLRGTTKFLSNNLVDPVMKANSTLSAIRQVLGMVDIGRTDSED
jgi:ABC-type dipeptide/oligopeptide/nickel transport system permease subunit